MLGALQATSFTAVSGVWCWASQLARSENILQGARGRDCLCKWMLQVTLQLWLCAAVHAVVGARGPAALQSPLPSRNSFSNQAPKGQEPSLLMSGTKKWNTALCDLMEKFGSPMTSPMQPLKDIIPENGNLWGQVRVPQERCRSSCELFTSLCKYTVQKSSSPELCKQKAPSRVDLGTRRASEIEGKQIQRSCSKWVSEQTFHLFFSSLTMLLPINGGQWSECYWTYLSSVLFSDDGNSCKILLDLKLSFSAYLAL